MNNVKVALGTRGMTVEAARRIGISGAPWCYWVNKIDAGYCLHGECVIRIVVICSNGSPPGACAEIHYMIRLREIVKKA